jgi:2-hydroxychromene-2-carboxylate isomerase
MTISGPGRTPNSPLAGLSDPRRPLVVLDLASVETHLLVGLLSRTVSEPRGALWCPLLSAPAELDRDRPRAERHAAALGFSVKWPRQHWRPAPRAMCVAALAMARGCAEPYLRTMSRMAFAAGVDVDEVFASTRREPLDSESFYVSASKSLGLSEAEVALAIQDPTEWESSLKSIATQLETIGITRAPAVRREGVIHVGASAILPLLAELDSSSACRSAA